MANGLGIGQVLAGIGSGLTEALQQQLFEEQRRRADLFDQLGALTISNIIEQQFRSKDPLVQAQIQYFKNKVQSPISSQERLINRIIGLENETRRLKGKPPLSPGEEANIIRTLGFRSDSLFPIIPFGETNEGGDIEDEIDELLEEAGILEQQSKIRGRKKENEVFPVVGPGIQQSLAEELEMKKRIGLNRKV